MGLNALKQGLSATILLMVEAVEFSVPDATKGIDIGAPFKEVGGIWEQFMEMGGQVCICDACLTHNGFTKDQIDNGMKSSAAEKSSPCFPKPRERCKSPSRFFEFHSIFFNEKAL